MNHKPSNHKAEWTAITLRYLAAAFCLFIGLYTFQMMDLWLMAGSLASIFVGTGLILKNLDSHEKSSRKRSSISINSKNTRTTDNHPIR